MNATLPRPAKVLGQLESALLAPPATLSDSATESASIKDWCLARADEWYARGERGAARDFLKHAAGADPSDAQVWIALGSLQFELGEYELAGLAFHMAGDLNPTNAQVFLHLGLLHQKLHHTDDAEALFRHALALAPANPLALGLLGLLLLTQNRHLEARPLFASVLQQNPNDVESLLRLGVCSFKIKDYNTALNCYERVLQLCPGHPLACENLGALRLISASACVLE